MKWGWVVISDAPDKYIACISLSSTTYDSVHNLTIPQNAKVSDSSIDRK